MKSDKHKDKELMMISKMLGQMYKDGIPINSSLDILRDVIYDKEYKESLTEILKYTNDGNSLSDSFKQFEFLYPPFFTGLISIGENTGKLYEVLKGLSLFYEKYTSILSQIKYAFMYPALILLSIFILFIFMIKNIIPSFFEIYQSLNIEMPFASKFLYEINNDLKNNLISTVILILSVVGLFIYTLIILFREFKNKIYKKINILKESMEYMTVLLFSIITSTGINISYALSYCKNSIRPKFLNDKIIEINNNILKGHSLTEALEESKILSRYSLAIVRIREESGSLEEGFKELSITLEKSLFQKIKRYLSMINPIFIVFMSIIIISILLVFILPLFENLNKGIVL